MQVTKDGVPMLWHDDTVLQKDLKPSSAGSKEGAETSREVAEMTAMEMREVVHPPHGDTLLRSEAGGGAAAGGNGDQFQSHLQLMRHFRGSKSRTAIPGPTLPW